jgi:hypothetical protein
MVDMSNTSQLTISVQILEDPTKRNLTVKLSLFEPTTVRLIHETEVDRG